VVSHGDRSGWLAFPVILFASAPHRQAHHAGAADGGQVTLAPASLLPLLPVVAGDRLAPRLALLGH